MANEKFDVETLSKLQYNFDQLVHTKKGCSHDDTIIDRIVALSIEVSEMANATKFFKFWSVTPCCRDAFVMEASDVLHFVLSIANHYGCNDLDFHSPDTETADSELYLKMSNVCVELAANQGMHVSLRTNTEKILNRFVSSYVRFLSNHGVTLNELQNAYFVKNKINHERQQNNY